MNGGDGIMEKPSKCCDFGEFTCDVPSHAKGRVIYIDFCIADIVNALNAANIKTEASCCGHGKIPGSIILSDGRVLTITEGLPEQTLRCV